MIKVLGGQNPETNAKGVHNERAHSHIPEDTNDSIANYTIKIEYMDNTSQAIDVPIFSDMLVNTALLIERAKDLENGNEMFNDILKPSNREPDDSGKEGSKKLPPMIALDHYHYMHFRKFFERYSKHYWIELKPMTPAPIGFLLSGPDFDNETVSSKF